MSDKPMLIRPRNTMLERLGGRPGVPGKIDESLLKKAEDRIAEVGAHAQRAEVSRRRILRVGGGREQRGPQQTGDDRLGFHWLALFACEWCLQNRGLHTAFPQSNYF